MALDFLKEPALGEIVNQEYSEAQLERSKQYIQSYKGEKENLHEDWLKDVPFDITPENREEYWRMFSATSPLSDDQTFKALVTDIDGEISSIDDPLERLMFLRDGASKWSDRVVEHYGPLIDKYDGFITADTAFKTRVGYKNNLRGRLAQFFAKNEADLDPMVSEAQHISDIRSIERNDLWGFMEMSKDGRVGVKNQAGEFLAANRLEDEVQNYEEFVIPSKEEQYMISQDSTKVIREYINPYLAQSRDRLKEQRKDSNKQLFRALQEGKIDSTEASPVIVNMVQQSDDSIDTVLGQGMEAVLDRSEDPLRDGGRMLAEISRLFVIRGEL